MNETSKIYVNIIAYIKEILLLAKATIALTVFILFRIQMEDAEYCMFWNKRFYLVFLARLLLIVTTNTGCFFEANSLNYKDVYCILAALTNSIE